MNISGWIVGWTSGGNYSALLFVPFAILVLITALKLVRYSEVIIVKTKFGGAFIGGVLIATITSIPELISEISQSFGGHPGASISNELGSNAFSAFLIAITIVSMWKTPFMKNLGRWSRIMMFSSSFLSLIISIFMFTTSDVEFGFPHALIGIIPLITFLVFCVMLVLQYKLGDDDEIAPDNIPDVTVKGAVLRIMFWSSLLICFSLALNWIVDAMMIGYKLEPNSAGGIFLAFAGSLPEIVAFIALVKKKRYVGGVAALVGSHLFNLAITFAGDLSYSKGAYYRNPEMSEAAPLAVLTGVMMLLLWLQALLSNKIKSNIIRLIIPTIIVIGYILGWIMIILYA